MLLTQTLTQTPMMYQCNGMCANSWEDAVLLSIRFLSNFAVFQLLSLQCFSFTSANFAERFGI